MVFNEACSKCFEHFNMKNMIKFFKSVKSLDFKLLNLCILVSFNVTLLSNVYRND